MANLTQKHIVKIIDLLKHEEKRLVEETDLPTEMAMARLYKDTEKRKEEELTFVRDLLRLLEEEIGKTVYKFESVSFDEPIKVDEKIGTLTPENYGLVPPKVYGN